MRAINPPGFSIPGISQAILVEDRHLLLLSGHVPFRADGTLAGPDLATQLEQVFENIAATLEVAGASFDAVARLTIYICEYDPCLLPTIRAIRDRWVNLERPPASALIGVASLFHPDVLVEIDALAVAPNG
ncbi:RidA family protein [Gloeobacter violaceus]|uniref:Gll3501 protein n=1 Tax=Gloeobacter violaceus (strain ATCC 29082 / PCC 7421) TaxID=251221 RepID=Q7NFM3_GLOVI|nr:RidA family protein [Gloeobacter violaceus]BAC91442.1 gll3501 [Gloeobacter violaceus PCC 7421]